MCGGCVYYFYVPGFGIVGYSEGDEDMGRCGHSFVNNAFVVRTSSSSCTTCLRTDNWRAETVLRLAFNSVAGDSLAEVEGVETFAFYSVVLRFSALSGVRQTNGMVSASFPPTNSHDRSRILCSSSPLFPTQRSLSRTPVLTGRRRV